MIEDKTLILRERLERVLSFRVEISAVVKRLNNTGIEKANKIKHECV